MRQRLIWVIDDLPVQPDMRILAYPLEAPLSINRVTDLDEITSALRDETMPVT
jgi:hypothetical protein